MDTYYVDTLDVGFHLEGLLSSSVEDVMKQHLLVATEAIAQGKEVPGLVMMKNIDHCFLHFFQI